MHETSKLPSTLSDYFHLRNKKTFSHSFNTKRLTIEYIKQKHTKLC